MAIRFIKWKKKGVKIGNLVLNHLQLIKCCLHGEQKLAATGVKCCSHWQLDFVFFTRMIKVDQLKHWSTLASWALLNFPPLFQRLSKFDVSWWKISKSEPIKWKLLFQCHHRINISFLRNYWLQLAKCLYSFVRKL